MGDPHQLQQQKPGKTASWKKVKNRVDSQVDALYGWHSIWYAMGLSMGVTVYTFPRHRQIDR